MKASNTRAMRVALEFVQAELESRCNNGHDWDSDREMLKVVNAALSAVPCDATGASRSSSGLRCGRTRSAMSLSATAT